jgi:hypothetical protein
MGFFTPVGFALKAATLAKKSACITAPLRQL